MAPDKFKGSLSSFEACESIRRGIRDAGYSGSVECFPMADGGDGFAGVLQHYLHTETVWCKTVDPLGKPITISWQWQGAAHTAIIELAVSSGLVLLPPEARNPLRTSTYGTGLVIRDAVEKGAKKIILGLGGSATNDAGTGILAALGFSFLNSRNEVLEPCGRSLHQMETIVTPNRIPSLIFEIACDVQNTLHGREGAAFVYAPQKGASESDVLLLDNGLKNFSRVLQQQTGQSVDHVPGSGAAGGIAAGLMGFFDVRLKKGIGMVMEAGGLHASMHGADLVISGEGRLDGQSKEGKVVSGVAALAATCQVPVIAFCGQLAVTEQELQATGLTAAFSITNRPMTLEEATAQAGSLLSQAVQQVLHFYLSVKNTKRKQPVS